MEEYKNKLGSLATKLKTDPPQMPIQEVHPVKTVDIEKEEEAQLNTSRLANNWNLLFVNNIFIVRRRPARANYNYPFIFQASVVRVNHIVQFGTPIFC